MDKTLFPELEKAIHEHNGRRRDPWGRFDRNDRYKAYEQKIERMRATIKYLTSLMGSHADAIRKRDQEIIELKFQLSQRNSIE
jgi:hypothetical protein